MPTPPEPSVYLNGEFLPLSEAKVSVLDRGFIFGDGIYEVIPVYGGRLFRLSHHLQRLDQSLASIHMENPFSHPQWQQLLEELVERNGGGEQSLYLQLTRGAAPRDLSIPGDTTPTLFAMSSPVGKAEVATLRRGLRAITVKDIRWQRCDIKTISLLPNVLLRREADEAGVDEAIFVRDGEITEGSASNIFIVRNGIVTTPPKGRYLLPGITRDLVVELCGRLGVQCEVRPIDEQALFEADEIWLTSSSREIMPLIELNQQPLANAQPGPIWERVISHYQAYKQAFREGREE
jgi:D-alanine transaminase